MMTQKIKITPNGNATRIDMDNCVQPFLWGKFPNGTPTKSSACCWPPIKHRDCFRNSGWLWNIFQLTFVSIKTRDRRGANSLRC